MATPTTKAKTATEALLDKFDSLVDSEAAKLDDQQVKELSRRLDSAVKKGRARSRQRERA